MRPPVGPTPRQITLRGESRASSSPGVDTGDRLTGAWHGLVLPTLEGKSQASSCPGVDPGTARVARGADWCCPP